MDHKNELTEEFKMVFPPMFRDMWMKTFNETFRNLLFAFYHANIGKKESIKDQTEDFKREVAINVLNELMPLYPLLTSLEKFGLPKSLIFITETGLAIDLLEVKGIDQNEVFNQVLDNIKMPKIKQP